MNKIDDLDESDPKMFWKLLNSLKPEMKNSSDSCIDLATWHTHFKNINSIPQCQTQLVAKLNDMLKGLDSSAGNELLDKVISQREILQACKNLKNVECGMDGILNEMIKYGHHALLPCLEKLFNIILSSGTYPKIWGEGYLITIFKSGSPSDPNNYRGITINSCLSKLFNSIK
jgi:hypothetical protein